MPYKHGSAGLSGSFSAAALDALWSDASILWHSATAPFIASSTMRIKCMRLKRMAILQVYGTFTCSTLPYTGVNNDASYMYSPTFQYSGIGIVQLTFSLPDNVFNGFHEAAASVIDARSAVYDDQTEEAKIARLYADSHAPSVGVLYIPGGVIPHHVYTVYGVLMYEVGNV